MEKSYLVKGEMRTSIGYDRFNKQVEAVSKERAIDKALSMVGGCHKVKRNQIKITSVEEIKVNA